MPIYDYTFLVLNGNRLLAAPFRLKSSHVWRDAGLVVCECWVGSYYLLIVIVEKHHSLTG